MNILAILGALVIGLSLGLTGAGGSILTLPILVHLAGVPPREAVGLSLFVVGVAALTGAISHWRSGNLHLPAAFAFGVSGMVGAAIGARFTALVPPAILMGMFALLMVGVALRMLVAKGASLDPDARCQLLRCLLAGGVTGMLTGFLGVGGGFLLMPALMRFGHLPITRATGTSLAVISVNALAGWLSHLPESAQRGDLMALFAGLAVVGTLLGKHLGRKMPARHLQMGFAVMVLVIGAWLFWQSIHP